MQLGIRLVEDSLPLQPHRDLPVYFLVSNAWVGRGMHGAHVGLGLEDAGHNFRLVPADLTGVGSKVDAGPEPVRD